MRIHAGEGVAASSSALPCEAIKTARRVGSGHGVNGVHAYVSLKILVPEEDDMQESGSRDKTVIEILERVSERPFKAC